MDNLSVYHAIQPHFPNVFSHCQYPFDPLFHLAFVRFHFRIDAHPYHSMASILSLLEDTDQRNEWAGTFTK